SEFGDRQAGLAVVQGDNDGRALIYDEGDVARRGRAGGGADTDPERDRLAFRRGVDVAAERGGRGRECRVDRLGQSSRTGLEAVPGGVGDEDAVGAGSECGDLQAGLAVVQGDN